MNTWIGGSFLFLCLALTSINLQAAPQATSLQADVFEAWVHGPMITVFKGPGRGYRQFDVLEKGEKVQLYRIRTDWVEISNKRIDKGWIRLQDLEKVIDRNGHPLGG